MKNRLAFCVLATTLTSITACGDSSFGAGNPGTDGGDDDGSPSVTGGRADGGSDDAMSMGDVVCSPEQADPTIGLFVDRNSTAPSGSCGSAAAPCATIQTAIDALATTAKTTVYVAVGTYAQSIALKPGMTIKGGWKNTGGTYARACSSNPAGDVIIQGTTNVAVKAADLQGTAALETLTITSKPAAASGESLYGIFATGASTTIALTNVVINVAAGGAGATGTPGTPAAPPGTGCAAGNSSPGTPAGAASATSPTTYSSLGFTASSGNAGPSGNPGGNGSLAQSGTGAGCGVGATICDTFPCGPHDNGTICAPAGAPGTAGCGGLGGGGGRGGTGGGSSIGVFAWDAKIIAASATISAGAGGLGGSGGSVGAPSTGTAEPARSAFVYTACSPTTANTCTTMTRYAVIGTAGAAGGSGSAGSVGGGGAGGDSYAVYKGGAATFTGTTTTLVAGAAGGAGGGNPAGPRGTSAQTN